MSKPKFKHMDTVLVFGLADHHYRGKVQQLEGRGGHSQEFIYRVQIERLPGPFPDGSHLLAEHQLRLASRDVPIHKTRLGSWEEIERTTGYVPEEG